MQSVQHLSQSVGKADMLRSGLPPNVPKIRHLFNNLAARPNARLLHIGINISYSLWGNADLKAHWIDEDFETAPPRPDVYPYTIVAVESTKMKPGILRHHANVLASEFVFCVDGWNSPDIRLGAAREINRLSKWDVAASVEIRDTGNRRGWDNGVGIFVMKSFGIETSQGPGS